MLLVRSLILVGVSLFFLSCSSASSPDEGQVEDSGAVVVEMPYTKTNVQVPRQLWQQIKEILEKDEISEDVRNSFSIQPTKISVEITGKDQGVLKGNTPYRVDFPEGGGDLDLFEYVSGRGDFSLSLAPQLMNDNPYHVLYLSESPGRLVGESKWGNGCHRIFDLSAKADALIGGSGLLVTTSRKQYLHLLAGVYVIFQMVEDRMLLGYIRISDSRYPQFTCSS